MAVSEAVQSAAISANPDRVLLVLINGEYIVVRKPIASVVVYKAAAMIVTQSAACANPDIPFMVTINALHNVAGQTRNVIEVLKPAVFEAREPFSGADPYNAAGILSQ